MKSDVIIVGAGLFGSVCAYLLKQAIPTINITVVERADHVGGTCYTKDIDGIQVHMYGAHIFRTNNDKLWKAVTDIVPMRPFINSPLANFYGKIYNLPFNMNTFNELWGAKTPAEAKQIIESQIVPCDEPTTVEEMALATVGNDIYNTFIKEYTEKQWHKDCSELPASIIRRLPIRFTYDNNYYTAKFQGVPFSYTDAINKLLSGVDVVLCCDGKKYFNSDALIIYTGPIDEFFDYQLGKLEYRSLHFEHTIMNTPNFQGNAVINYTGSDVKYTRSIEHKHFYGDVRSPTSVVTYEYPADVGDPFYPIEDMRNLELYTRYSELAKQIVPNVLFCGRLGSYKYYDMADTILAANELVKGLLKEEENEISN